MHAVRAHVPSEGAHGDAPTDAHRRETSAVSILRAHVRTRVRRQTARVHAHGRENVPMHARELHEGLLEDAELQTTHEHALGRARSHVCEMQPVVRDELPHEETCRRVQRPEAEHGVECSDGRRARTEYSEEAHPETE